MLRNVVFDMGMVLLHYEPYLACLRYGGNAEDAAALKAAIFGCPEWARLDGGTVSEEEHWAGALKRLPTEKLKTAALALQKDWHLDSLWPMRGMDAVIERARERGLKLYIISNAGTRFRQYQYKIPHVEWFDGIVVSAEEKTLKPEPEIFRILCDRYHLKPEECIFIDDAPANVQGAKAVGMQGYLFADGDANKLKDALETL